MSLSVSPFPCFCHYYSVLLFLTILLGVGGLQVRGPGTAIQRASANVDCTEVLTKNLECPNIGSYPVAGTCEYFSRCFQTETGVESIVEFCPEGQVYILNRCTKSNDPSSCPQKHCPLNNRRREQETTTPRNNVHAGQPTKKTKPLSNLHPSLSDAATPACWQIFVFIVPLAIIMCV